GSPLANAGAITAVSALRRGGPALLCGQDGWPRVSPAGTKRAGSAAPALACLGLEVLSRRIRGRGCGYAPLVRRSRASEGLAAGRSGTRFVRLIADGERGG